MVYGRGKEGGESFLGGEKSAGKNIGRGKGARDLGKTRREKVGGEKKDTGKGNFFWWYIFFGGEREPTHTQQLAL